MRPGQAAVRAGVLVILVAAGCSSSSATEAVPGFRQTYATTKCKIGGHVSMSAFSVFDQWAGDNGVFRIDVQNDNAYCTVNFPLVDGPPMATEVADVRAYFTGIGMPADQVGSIEESYESLPADGTTFVIPKISRVVEGVPVSESVAFASLVDGASYAEDVYWPELPATVLTELQALQAIVSDAGKLKSFQQKLPSSFVTGSVVIHHTSQFVIDRPNLRGRARFDAHACYDAVLDQGGFGRTQCYLADGSAFTFPTTTE